MDKLFSEQELLHLRANEKGITLDLACQLADTMRENERLRGMLGTVDAFATSVWGDCKGCATDHDRMVQFGWSILKIKEAANDCSFEAAIKQFLEKHDQPNKHTGVPGCNCALCTGAVKLAKGGGGGPHKPSQNTDDSPQARRIKRKLERSQNTETEK